MTLCGTSVSPAHVRLSRRCAVRCVRSLALVVAVAISATPRVALAHAHLVKCSPGNGAHLPSSPKLIQLWFSEAAEATMTTITITGPSGKSVAIGPVGVDPHNPLSLAATVASPLSTGKYTLIWRTVAKDDGHPSQGTFTFTVDGDTAAAVMSAIAAGGSTKDSATVSIGVAPITASAPGAMDLESPSIVLARWLNFAGIIMMIGTVAFRTLVVPGVTGQGNVQNNGSFAYRATRGAAKLGLISAAVTLIAGIGRLYAQQAVVGDGVGIRTILHSFWGQIWCVELALALLACLAFAIASSSHGVVGRDRAWIAATMAALLLGATPSMSGHAMGAPEHRSISVALDIVHVIAAGGWLGGLLVVTLVGVPLAVAVAGDDGATGGVSLVAMLVNAFSPFALVFATAVVASGAVAAWLRIGSLAQLFHSAYGTVLLIKLGFVLLVLAGGAFNWLRMRSALSHREAGATAIGAFRRSAWLELSAGILVIVATAVLVATPPPIH